MKLIEELEDLMQLEELSTYQSDRIDCLTKALDTQDKILLVDADSILYQIAYKYVENNEEIDYNEQYENFHSTIRAIANKIEDDGFHVSNFIYFFTTYKNNFRKKILPSYKANREVTPLVVLVKKIKDYIIEKLEEENIQVFYSDVFEADDVISHYKKSIKSKLFYNYIICSIDKDLKQIEGIHFDYYKKKIGVDEYGNDIKVYKGWSYTTKQDSFDLLMKMLLVGDSSDNIRGCLKIGPKTAEKMLAGKNNFGKYRAVINAYNNINRLKKNIKLIQL